MFKDLYDAVSFLWSWTWPTVDGTATEVLVERIRHQRNPDTFRLSITYEFSIGVDGPIPVNRFGHLRFVETGASLLLVTKSMLISAYLCGIGQMTQA
jgi:hypothetical protein